MDPSTLNTSFIIEEYPVVNTLINAIHTTIQINEYIRSKYLNDRNEFSNQQMKILYENIDLLEDNSLILNQALQAIKTLMSEIKNLKELYENEIHNKNYKNSDLKKNNHNTNISKVINYDSNVNYLDTEILNRYNLHSNMGNYDQNQNIGNSNNYNMNFNSNDFNKSEDEMKILDNSIKTNHLSNNSIYYINNQNNNFDECAVKLNYDYSNTDCVERFEKNENYEKPIDRFNDLYQNQLKKKNYPKKIYNSNLEINRSNENAEKKSSDYNNERPLEKFGLNQNQKKDSQKAELSYDKKPLRQKILLNKAKEFEIKRDDHRVENHNNSKTNNDEFEDSNSSFKSNIKNINRVNLSMFQENVSIEIIKISNEIMKNIEITERYPDYFAKKFSNDSYKNFLNNIIGYRYNKTTLENILRDINIKYKIENMNLPKSLHSIPKFFNKHCYDDENNPPNSGNSDKYISEIIERQDELNNNIDNEKHKIRSKNFSKKIENQQSNYVMNPEINKSLIDMSKHEYNNNNNNLIFTNKKNVETLAKNAKNNSSIYKRSKIQRSLTRNSSFELNRKRSPNKTLNNENLNFEKLLRSNSGTKDYSNKKKNRPFNRFTKSYGNFFDKNILKKINSSNSPGAYELKTTKQ